MTSSTLDLPARLAAAIDAARAAGAHLARLAQHRDALVIEAKGPQDFVSRADREAEDIVRERLLGAFPGDGFLGEEGGGSGIDTGAPVWVVDPLDGTTNFLHGLPQFCVSIGLWAGGRGVLGVIYQPIGDQLYTAVEGEGAFRNGTRLRASAVSEVSSALIAFGHAPRVPFSAWLRDATPPMEAGTALRNIGSGALMLAHVAAGEFDGFYELRMHPWDALAGLVLVQEAGGRSIAYPDGRLQDGGLVLATAPGIFDAMCRLIPAVAGR